MDNLAELTELQYRKDCLHKHRTQLLQNIAECADKIKVIDKEIDMIMGQQLEQDLHSNRQQAHLLQERLEQSNTQRTESQNMEPRLSCHGLECVGGGDGILKIRGDG